MHLEGLDILIEKYLNGKATEEERRQIDDWYQSYDATSSLSEQMSKQEMEKWMELSLRKLRTKLD